MPKPTLVMPTGAWHVPEHYKYLILYLKSHGYKCVPVALPSMHPTNGVYATSPLIADIAAIRTAIESELVHANVIMVLHSYGGFPGMSACRDLDTATRHAAGHETSVVAIAGMCFFMVPAGLSLLDAVGGAPPAVHDYRGDLIYVSGDPAVWFYSDCEPEVQEWASKLLVPQAKGAVLEKGSYSAYLHIRTGYLLTSRDVPFPVEAQKKLVDAARAEGAEIKAEVVDSAHSPFLSRVRETGDYVRRVAGEDLVSDLEPY